MSRPGEYVYGEFRKDYCEACGKGHVGGKPAFDVHHMDGNIRNNSEGNLKTMCRACHAKLHHADGTWGRGRLAVRECVLCGGKFTDEMGKRAKTCSDRCFQLIYGLRKAGVEELRDDPEKLKQRVASLEWMKKFSGPRGTKRTNAKKVKAG